MEKVNDKTEETRKSCEFDKKFLHMWWVIGILVILVILLISFIITCRVLCADKIMVYVSYASLLLSITLSIIAIQYTYTSNNDTRRQFEKINASAESINQASIKLNSVGDQIEHHIADISKKITVSAESINQASIKLNSVGEQLEHHIADILGNLTDIKSSQLSMNSTIENINTNITSNSKISNNSAFTTNSQEIAHSTSPKPSNSAKPTIKETNEIQQIKDKDIEKVTKEDII